MLAAIVKRIKRLADSEVGSSLWPVRLFRRALRLGCELYEAALDAPIAPTPAAPGAPREAAPVVLYVEWDSPGRADMERILKARNIQYRVLAIDHDEATQSFLKSTVKREPPVLFIAGDPIGGLEELKRLDASGQLVRRVRGEAPVAEPAPVALGNPDRPAQVYGSRNDQWTGRCTILLEQRQIDFDFIDLDEPKNAPLRDRLVAETKHNVMPYVFVRGRFLGGWSELDERERLGQLDDLLEPPSPAAGEGRPRIRIVVADRPSEDVPPGSR